MTNGKYKTIDSNYNMANGKCNSLYGKYNITNRKYKTIDSNYNITNGKCNSLNGKQYIITTKHNSPNQNLKSNGINLIIIND